MAVIGEAFVAIKADFSAFGGEFASGLTRALNSSVLKNIDRNINVPITKGIAQNLSRSFAENIASLPIPAAQSAKLVKQFSASLQRAVTAGTKVPVSVSSLVDLRPDTRSQQAFSSAIKETQSFLARQMVRIPTGATGSDILQLGRFEEGKVAIRNLGAVFSTAGAPVKSFGEKITMAARSGAVLERALNTLGASALPLGPTLSRVAGTFQTFQSLAAQGVIGKGLAGQFTVAALGAEAFVKVLSAGIERATQEQAALAQVSAAIESTGHAAGLTTGDIAGFAKKLQDLTGFSKIEIEQAEALGLAFTNIKGADQFRTLALAADVARREGISLTSAMQKLGSVIQDPSKAAVIFSQRVLGLTTLERQHIQTLQSTGQSAEALTIVMERLQKSFSGAAAAFAQTLPGQIAILKQNFGDIAESLGKTVLPIVLDFVRGLNSLVQLIEHIPAPIKVAAAGLLVYAAAARVAALAAAAFGITSTAGLAAIPILAGLAAVGITIYGAASGVASQKSNDLSEALGLNKQRVQSLGEALPAVTRGLQDLGLKYEDIITDSAAYSQAQQKIADDYEKLSSLQSRFNELGEQEVKNREALAEATARQHATLYAISKVQSEQNAQLDIYQNSVIAAEQAQLSLAQAEKTHQTSLYDLNRARLNANEILHGYVRGLAESVHTEEDAFQATQKITQAQLDLNAATRDQTHAQNELQRAIADLADQDIQLARSTLIAQRVTQVFGAQSRQGQYAARLLARAHADQSDAALRVGAATDGIVGAQSKYDAQLRDTNAALHGYAANTTEAHAATVALNSAQEQATASALAIRAAQIAVRDAAYQAAYNEDLYKSSLEGQLPLSDRAAAAAANVRDSQKALTGTLREITDVSRQYADQLHRINDELAVMARADPEVLARSLTIASPFGAPIIISPSALQAPSGGKPKSDTQKGVQGIGNLPPYIPVMQLGGVVPGMPGAEQLILAHGGELVLPAGDRNEINRNTPGWIHAPRLTDAELPNYQPGGLDKTWGPNAPKQKLQVNLQMQSAPLVLDGQVLGRLLIRYIRQAERSLGQGAIT